MEKLTGKIISGTGKGRKFVKLYSQVFQKYINMNPFYGTLNIQLEKEFVTPEDALHINEKQIYEIMNSNYAGIFLIECKLFDQDLWIVRPELTEHDKKIIEIIAPYNLREKYNLETGNNLEVLV